MKRIIEEVYDSGRSEASRLAPVEGLKGAKHQATPSWAAVVANWELLSGQFRDSAAHEFARPTCLTP